MTIARTVAELARDVHADSADSIGQEIGELLQIVDNGGAAALPAIDGSQLTGIAAGGSDTAINRVDGIATAGQTEFAVASDDIPWMAINGVSLHYPTDFSFANGIVTLLTPLAEGELLTGLGWVNAAGEGGGGTGGTGGGFTATTSPVGYTGTSVFAPWVIHNGTAANYSVETQQFNGIDKETLVFTNADTLAIYNPDITFDLNTQTVVLTLLDRDEVLQGSQKAFVGGGYRVQGTSDRGMNALLVTGTADRLQVGTPHQGRSLLTTPNGTLPAADEYKHIITMSSVVENEITIRTDVYNNVTGVLLLSLEHTRSSTNTGGGSTPNYTPYETGDIGQMNLFISHFGNTGRRFIHIESVEIT